MAFSPGVFYQADLLTLCHSFSVSSPFSPLPISPLSSCRLHLIEFLPNPPSEHHSLIHSVQQCQSSPPILLFSLLSYVAETGVYQLSYAAFCFLTEGYSIWNPQGGADWRLKIKMCGGEFGKKIKSMGGGGRWPKKCMGGCPRKNKNVWGGRPGFFPVRPPPEDFKWNSPNTWTDKSLRIESGEFKWCFTKAWLKLVFLRGAVHQW